MYNFGPDWNDISEEYEIKLIDIFGIFDGKFDANFIIIEFNFKVLFFINNVWYLDANFGGCLVPCIGEFGCY